MKPGALWQVFVPPELAYGLRGQRPVGPNEALVFDQDGALAGFALFFHKFSTFLGEPGIYLEDLFVLPEKRGLGIGEVLLTFLGHLALERDCQRIEWVVLDWNEPALKFYRRLGAQALDDWTGHRVDGDALTALAAKFPSS